VPAADGHRQAVDVLRFTADGRTLISGDRASEVRWWDVAKQKQVAKLDLDGAAFDVFPDGRKVVASGPNGLKVLDDGGKSILTVDGQHGLVRVAPAGKHFAGFNEGVIRVTAAASGKDLHRFTPHLVNRYADMHFSGDGKTLVVGSVTPARSGPERD